MGILGRLGYFLAPMSDRVLTLAGADSLQVTTIVADVGPESTKRFFEFFTVRSVTEFEHLQNKRNPDQIRKLLDELEAFCALKQ